jgi:hypothetical protein
MANSTITLQGYDALERKIAQLSTENPGFSKRLRDVIAKVLKEARNEISSRAEQGLQMKSDPRHAYRAVRYAVYKRIFGGQVNILQSRKTHSPNGYEPVRKLQPKQRGGNRRQRSKRTDNVMHYEGMDRGFILRFLNNGTGQRAISKLTEIKRSSGVSKYRFVKDASRYGNRGSIAARNWFGRESLEEFQSISHTLQNIIDEIINEEFV